MYQMFLKHFLFREALLSILHETDCIFVDGTFKLSPPMFTQVVVVIAKKRQLAVTILYCLLQVSIEIISLKEFNCPVPSTHNTVSVY